MHDNKMRLDMTIVDDKKMSAVFTLNDMGSKFVNIELVGCKVIATFPPSSDSETPVTWVLCHEWPTSSLHPSGAQLAYAIVDGLVNDGFQECNVELGTFDCLICNPRTVH